MATTGLRHNVRGVKVLAALWSYVRPEFLQWFRLLSEVALITPLALHFMPWAVLWPPFLFAAWLTLLMASAHYLERVLNELRIPSGRRRLLLIAVGLMVVVINLRLLLYDPPSLLSVAWLSELYARLTETSNPNGQQDFAILFLTALAWWRGIALSGRRLDSKETGLRFRIGIAVLLPLVLFVVDPVDGTPFVLLFLLSSLMTIALTRAQQVEAGETDTAFPITPSWLLRILGASTGMMLLAALLTSLLSGQQLTTLLGFFAPLWQALQLVVTVVVAVIFSAARPFLALFEWLAAAFAAWWASLPQATIVATQTPPPDAGLGTATPEPEVFVPASNLALDLLNWIVANARPIGVVIVVLLLLTITWYAYRSRRQLSTGRNVRQGTRASSRQPRGAGGFPGSGLLDNVRRWRQLWNAASIRRIYDNMSYVAARNGWPRPVAETPYEYMSALQQVWPEHSGEVDLITQAYIQVRYGEVPETRAELAEIQAAWERLRQAPAVRRLQAPEDEATE